MQEKPTAFYTVAFEHAFPIPYLLLERLAVKLAGVEDEDSSIAVIAECVQECGLTNGKPNRDELAYVVGRLGSIKHSEEGGADKPKVDTKMFAGEYLKWVEGMTHDTFCMYIAGYDPQLAEHLYCDVDYEYVQELGEHKLTRDWLEMKGRFEAVLFGFGGSYGDDKARDPDEVELKEMNKLLGL